MRLFHCTTCGQDNLKKKCSHAPKTQTRPKPFHHPQPR